MLRARLITRWTGRITRNVERCEITDERTFTDLDAARQAAECMLSVLDYAYGCGTHSVYVHKMTQPGAHAAESSYIASS